MPGLSEVGDSKGEHKLLIANVDKNTRVSRIYRSDYECFWMRKSRREVTKLGRLLKHVRTFAAYVAITREMREWCERERILLRIKSPGVEHPREQQAQSSKSPTIYEVSPSSAPAVMHDSERGDQHQATKTVNEQSADSTVTPAQPS